MFCLISWDSPFLSIYVLQLYSIFIYILFYSPDKQNPYKGQKDKQYPYKDKNYGGDGGAGGAYDPNAGAGAGAGGAKRPGSGYKPSRGKGDYGSFQKEYDIIHLARKGYRDGYHYT